MSEEAAELLRIQLLGGFSVSLGARQFSAQDLRLRAAQTLITLLALAPGYQLHREQAMEAIWPEQAPRAAANSLNQALYVARRALALPAGFAFLTLRDQRLRLADPALLWVDAVAFEAQARQAQQAHDLPAAIAALELYCGDLLPDEPYAVAFDARRVALRERFRSLLLHITAWSSTSTQAAQLITALQQALAADPVDEELHRALIHLYLHSGQRQAAQAQFQLLERTLRHELDLAPDALSRQLYQDMLASDQAPAALATHPEAPPLRMSRLPVPLTSFVGRAEELAELRRRLATTRLLTIVGPGGSGKTRLALEVARTEAMFFADGACFVELAALAEPALLVQTIAAALGVREGQGSSLQEQLVAALASRRLLLVLDNCEHLILACAHFAAALLQACPGLRILATSREPLHIGGEITWLIPALALPDPQQQPPTLAEIERYAALQLFVERASAAQAQFALRPDEVPTLIELCTRLDGLPLAIELAAARVPLLSVAQLVARLADRLRLLTAGSRSALTRQQTLRATIDWSYDLLSDQERRLFRRLAVFAGGWTLEAAEEVCADAALAQNEVLPLLAQLADKSLLVVRDKPAARRYELLESMRQYAFEQLQAVGEEERLRDRQQVWCLAFAAQGERELTGPNQVVWLDRLASELDNLRAALQWTASAHGDDVPWLRLAYRLYWFWYLHSAVGEGRAVFEQALRQTAANERSWRRGIALLGAGSMALYQGDLASARTRLEASLPILQRTDDCFSQALAPFMAGTVALNQGDYAPARAWLETSLPQFEALGHRQGFATALLHLGDVALGQGAADEAEANYRRCLAIHYADTGSSWGIAQAENNLGEVARYRGDYAAAAAHYAAALAGFAQLATKADVARTRHNLAALALDTGDHSAAEAGFQASLALFREWGNCRGIVECIAGLAQLRAAQASDAEGWERAATLLAYVATYFAQNGAVMWPPDRQAFARTQASLAGHLSDAQITAATVRGQALSLPEALALALEQSAEGMSQRMAI